MKTHTHFTLGLLLTTLVLPATFGQKGLSVERPGDGRLVCGLGKSFHSGRRAELMKRFGDQLLVFRGLPNVRENVVFRQDKSFWYLTGVESPNVNLVLDGASGRQILFVPEGNAMLYRSETWEGEKWDTTDKWIGELTGFEEVRANGELLDVIDSLLGKRTQIGVCKHPPIVLSGSYDTAGKFLGQQKADELDGRPSRTEALAAKLEERFEVGIFDVSEELIDMRRIKTAEELNALRHAADAGALAMVEAMRSTRPGLGEWELDGLMSWMQIRHGAEGMAYAAIVGSGANACILHYIANDRLMQAGEVVLIDYGPEVDHYVTDITRSWPVDGEFTERQAEIYEAVLEAQLAGIAAAKPGVTLGQVSEVCNQVLKDKGYGEYIKHGACHFVGMEVHDPGEYRAPVEPGVVFTIEPGVYDVEAGIGIRIEDVVVITEDGCEVITALVPKQMEEVEDLVRSRGILDILDEGTATAK